VNGRHRIPDGTTSTAINEVKNVAYQAYTQQLKDSVDIAKNMLGNMNLYTRPTTTLSQPLQDAIKAGDVIHGFIP
jgi:Restriction endonuclease fold toxin 7